MALRILTTILLTSLCSFGEVYQLANVAGRALGRTADGERAALQYDTYTNSTTWLTGQMFGDAMTDFSPEREDAVIESPCLKLNGAGDYVEVNSSSNLCNGGTAPFTISGWRYIKYRPNKI